MPQRKTSKYSCGYLIRGHHSSRKVQGMSTSLTQLTGTLLVQLFDAAGNIKNEWTMKNLITDAGDLYYATRAVASVSPGGPSQPTLVTGMKLGTGSTAVSKAGAGSALVTYKSGSNVVFDATYPQVLNLGAGLGVQGVYRVTFAAGVATDTALTEVVIVNDAASNATSTAGNTISRVLFPTAINKGASDTLAVTWNHKFLGA